MEIDCEEIVSSLQKCGINFLAIDFDQTLISEHTYGNWQGTVSELASKVRPFFLKLIPVAAANGLQLAIVTFSPQSSIIYGVLQHHFPDIVCNIPIRGQDGSWEYHGVASRDGKQSHMASAAEELMQRSGIQITRKTTLLLDDDFNNCKIARRDMVHAVHIDPKNVSKSMELLKKLHLIYENKGST